MSDAPDARDSEGVDEPTAAAAPPAQPAQPAPAPDLPPPGKRGPAANRPPGQQTLPPRPVQTPAQPAEGGYETIERFGRPLRVFPVAVSSEVMAQAWANKENAPHGATVVVRHEINPRGLHGALWGTPPADTLSCAVVLRPPVSPEEGDVAWLVAAVSAVDAVRSHTGVQASTWWPDQIIEPEFNDPVGAVKAEIQLGPGQVKSAVVTLRFDLPRLDIEGEEARDAFLGAVVGAVDSVATMLVDDGASAVARAFDERCAMLEKRVKVRLRPKGETRGIARRVDRAARLEVESMSGMVEKIGVNQLMELEVVERPSH